MKLNIDGKTHLLVSGCSFTDGFAQKELGSWAYYLSNMMGLNLINKARGGSGNEYIADSIITYLINNQNILNNVVVGVAWSEFTRLMSPIDDGSDYILDTVRPQDFIKFNGIQGKFYNNKDCSKFFSDIPFCIYKTYMSILKLNYFLDFYKIPYFYIDAINKNEVNKNKKSMIEISTRGSFDFVEYDISKFPKEYSSIINSENNKLIFKNFLKIGEFDTILDYMYQDYSKYEKDNEGHPNHIASKEVAEIIYKQIT